MNDMSNFYVYCYRNPMKNNEPFYIGKGKGKRHLAHLKEKKNSHKVNTIKKILKNNLEPIIEIIDDNLTEEQAFELEMFLIQEIGRKDLKIGPLTNLTDGGEGSSGRICSDEIKAKFSNERKGSGNPMFGKTHSDEFKESRKGSGNPMFGKTHSDEFKAVLSARTGENHPNFGKPLSDEHKMKLAFAFSGDKNSRARTVSVNGIIFTTITEGAKYLGIARSTLNNWVISSKEIHKEYFYVDKT